MKLGGTPRRGKTRRIDIIGSPNGLSARQTMGLVLAVALTMALFPMAARAGTAFINVIITDPDHSRQAHVDSGGNLQVGGSVNVANTPLAVTTADDPGRQAFAFDGAGKFAVNEDLAETTFTVPRGKRLVIEFVSEEAQLPGDQRLIAGRIVVALHGAVSVFNVVPTFTGTDALFGLDRSIASQDLTLYADGGTDVSLQAIRDSTVATGDFAGQISGHLIDCSTGACS